MYCNLLVEGYVDEAAGRRLLRHTGHDAGTTFGRNGWRYIEQKVAGFNRSCVGQGLLTLVDFMDTGRECPAQVVQEWLPERADKHVFRLVVREIESWVLADRNAIAGFLSVPVAKIPHNPDLLDDPKQTLIALARTSRSKTIRDGLVPKAGHAASEGPLYASELARFLMDFWNPDEAQLQSDSLMRCLKRLKELHNLDG